MLLRAAAHAQSISNTKSADMATGSLESSGYGATSSSGKLMAQSILAAHSSYILFSQYGYDKVIQLQTTISRHARPLPYRLCYQLCP